MVDALYGHFAVAFPPELLKEASTSLSEKGFSKQRLLDGEGLEYLDQTKDGHQKETQFYWGKVLRHGDLPAQELPIARFHFQVIEFVDSIPIQGALMRSTGDIENVGRSQCVLLHLAADMLRNESGRRKRAPGRGRVFTSVQELRRIELRNSLPATEALSEDTPTEGIIVKSNSHDACHPSHDRDFRTLGFFLPSVLLDLKTGRLRIFDVGRAPMVMKRQCIFSRTLAGAMLPHISI